MASQAHAAKESLLHALTERFAVNKVDRAGRCYRLDDVFNINLAYSRTFQKHNYASFFFGIPPDIVTNQNTVTDIIAFICENADMIFAIPLRHIDEIAISRGTYKLHINVPPEGPGAAYIQEDPDRKPLRNFLHNSESLCKLLLEHGKSLSSGQAKTDAEEAYESEKQKALHGEIQRKIVELGKIWGMHAEQEFKVEGFKYDAVWKERKELGVRKAFEVQHKGSLESALVKLKHAYDMWRSDLILVVTGEKDINRVKKLMAPKLFGAFHEISHTKVIGPETIDELHRVITANEQTMRLLLKR